MNKEGINSCNEIEIEVTEVESNESIKKSEKINENDDTSSVNESVKYSIPAATIVSYLISCLWAGIGFHKLFYYDSGEYYGDPINAYVGGDAYNFIINANYATAYFVLALISIVLGSTFAIVKAINHSK